MGRASQHPLLRPSSFRGVEKISSFWSYADFQHRSNERMVVLSQTRSSSFHKVEKLFPVDGMKLFRNIRTDGWAGFPKHGPVPLKVLKKLFVWMFSRQLKTVKFMSGPRFSTSPVTGQLVSRRWKIVSFWCFADFQQRSNERMVVLPQTRSRTFHGVENSFHLDGMKLFKNNEVIGWAVLPQTRPNCFHGVEKTFRLNVMQPFRNIQVYGWAAFLIWRCWKTF